jgi:hypothetical protein
LTTRRQDTEETQRAKGNVFSGQRDTVTASLRDTVTASLQACHLRQDIYMAVERHQQGLQTDFN